MLYTHAHRDSVAREGQGLMDTAAQRGSSQFDNTTRGVVIPVRAGRRMKGVAPRTNRGRIGTNQANADAFHTAERHTRVRVLPSCSVHTGPRPRAGTARADDAAITDNAAAANLPTLSATKEIDLGTA